MDKDLFHAIIQIATGKEPNISEAKTKALEKLAIEVITELDTTLELLSSEDISIRNKAINTLIRKPNMDLMRNDAPIAREWFLDKKNKDALFSYIDKENDKGCLSLYIELISAVCKRFAITSMCFGERPSDTGYLQDAYKLFSRFLSHSDKSVRFEASKALTFFRYDDAWNVIYQILSDKPNSKRYQSVAITLFNNSRPLHKSTSELFDKMKISYNKKGLPKDIAKKLSIALTDAFSKKINPETKESVLKALGAMGDESVADQLMTFYEKEEDEFIRRKWINTLININGKDISGFVKSAIKQEEDEFTKVEMAESFAKVATKEDLPFFEEILQRMQVKHCISVLEHCISTLKKKA